MDTTTDTARADALRVLAAQESDATLTGWVEFVGTADDARAAFTAELTRRTRLATRADLARDLNAVANALSGMLDTWQSAEADDPFAASALAEDEYPFDVSLDDLTANVFAAVARIAERDDAEHDAQANTAAAPDATPKPGTGLYACAECGTRTARTYVVTTLDRDDPEGTTTEVCLACHEPDKGGLTFTRV